MLGRTKLLKVDTVITETTADKSINATIRLNRPALKIWRDEAHLRDVTGTVMNGQILIEGVLHKQIFFVALDDDRIFHQPEDIPFNIFVPCASLVNVQGRNLKAIVTATVQKINFTLSETDPRELEEQVIVQFFIKVVETMQMNVNLSNNGPLIKADVVIGENTTAVAATAEVPLSRPAVKVREVRTSVGEVAAEVLADHVAITGTVKSQIFFVSTDQVARHQSAEIPFSAIVEVAGAESGMNVDVIARVVRIDRTLVAGGTSVVLRAVLQVFAKVTETAQVCVEILPSGPLVRTFRVVGEKTAQVMVEDTARLPVRAVKVQDVDCSVRDVTFEVLNDKVVVNGIVHKQVFFVGTDDILRHFPEDIPFSCVVDVPGAKPGMDVHTMSRCEHISWRLTNDGPVAADLAETSLGSGFDDVLVCQTPNDDHHRGFRFLRQRVVVDVFVKLSEESQLNIFASPVTTASQVAAIQAANNPVVNC
ncbi:MAG: DUF3794 domain-containing protein [Symbiobacteriia bacterium]